MDVNYNQCLLITAPLIQGEPEWATSHSAPLHWCHDERPCMVEQYHMVYHEWEQISAHQTRKGGVQ